MTASSAGSVLDQLVVPLKEVAGAVDTLPRLAQCFETP